MDSRRKIWSRNFMRRNQRRVAVLVINGIKERAKKKINNDTSRIAYYTVSMCFISSCTDWMAFVYKRIASKSRFICFLVKTDIISSSIIFSVSIYVISINRIYLFNNNMKKSFKCVFLKKNLIIMASTVVIGLYKRNN